MAGVKIWSDAYSALVLHQVKSGECHFSKVYDGLGVFVIRLDAILILDGLGIQESTKTRNQGKPCGHTGELTSGYAYGLSASAIKRAASLRITGELQSQRVVLGVSCLLVLHRWSYLRCLRWGHFRQVRRPTSHHQPPASKHQPRRARTGE